MTLFMRKFRVCFAKRLSGKQQALDYDWDMQIPSNIRLELWGAPRAEMRGVLFFLIVRRIVYLCLVIFGVIYAQ